MSSPNLKHCRNTEITAKTLSADFISKMRNLRTAVTSSTRVETTSISDGLKVMETEQVMETHTKWKVERKTDMQEKDI